MGKSCIVKGCIVGKKDMGTLSFHRLPKDEVCRKKWIDHIGEENIKVNAHTRICSRHFEEKCFDRLGFQTTLQHSSVPTLLLQKKIIHPALAPPKPPLNNKQIYNVYTIADDATIKLASSFQRPLIDQLEPEPEQKLDKQPEAVGKKISIDGTTLETYHRSIQDPATKQYMRVVPVHENSINVQLQIMKREMNEYKHKYLKAIKSLKDARKKIHTLQMRNRRQEVRIKKLTNINQDLKEENQLCSETEIVIVGLPDGIELESTWIK